MGQRVWCVQVCRPVNLHLASHDLRVLSQGRVSLGSDQNVVCDARVVISASLVRELSSKLQTDIEKHDSHQDGDWAVVCNDGVPLLNVGLRACCAKVARDQHETPLCAGLGVVL